ncbi:MAG: indolepyruvate ferredoxin oxidoreductase subunit alpha [Promethearchaeota archaeon]|nr:MAG: indolepyruvate ferredoxin oxidoreductase subunit alpha [Candidatus Lokiarchaeota archaeon]
MQISELFIDSPGKKVLMSGNEAFARGIYEAGIKFASNYPGTPMSEVGDYLNFHSETSQEFTFDYSLNEKVALESAIGASWAGVRSATMFKHLGLNVAADPLHTFPYSGTNGGMIILAGGDPSILSSTNAQDNRLYSLHTKIVIVSPSTVQECKDFIKDAIRLSELHNVPVYVHTNTRLCHSHGIVEYGEIMEAESGGYFEKNPDRYINTRTRALNNQKQYFKKIAQIARNKKLFHLFNKIKEIDKESPKAPIGILTSDICFSYVIQACHKLNLNPPILKLGLIFPINREEICHFADKYNLEKLLVIEELEAYIETYSKRVFCNFCDAKRDLAVYGKEFLPITGELNTDIIMNFLAQHFEIKNQYLLEEIQEKQKALDDIFPNLPLREPTFCPGCPYRTVFYALKDVEEDLREEKNIGLIYGGDIGCYTLSEAYPYETIDWVICMGAGIGISNGMALSVDPKRQKIIAFVGDSTLFHTGLQPLINAIKNNIDLTVLIFNNYWTAMTGHQEFAATPSEIIKRDGQKSKTEQRKIDLIQLLKSLNAENLTVSGAYNISKLKKLFKSEILKSGVKIIIINEECALEKKRRNRREESQPQREQVYYTITDTCVKCNECIEAFGCPAINARYKDQRSPSNKPQTEKEIEYYIDEARCLPKICEGMCKSVCKNAAIKKTVINRYFDKNAEKKG